MSDPRAQMALQSTDDLMKRLTDLDPADFTAAFGRAPEAAGAGLEGIASADDYRAVFQFDAGRRVLADLVDRFLHRGTYVVGSDPAVAVYDAGLRAVVLEIMWRASREEDK